MDGQKKKEEALEIEGVVVESVKGAFRVEIEVPDEDREAKKDRSDRSESSRW